MGKRSTSTTKSGKFMNPTDQARKEARKRELKKNKKQRQLVRAAVLKGKNPRELIVELEKIDDMEFNPLAPPPLNEKVLREKRRKLIETWNRVIQMYEKEDPEQYAELKKVWNNYQMRLNEITTHYNAVRNAQNVRIDDIPLPNTMGPSDEDGNFLTTDIPLPPSMLQPKAGILKKPSVFESLRPKTCPGVPLGPPPLLADYFEEEEEDKEEEETDKKSKTTNEETETERKKKIRFADAEDSDAEEEADENADKEDQEEDGQDGDDDVGVPGEEPDVLTPLVAKEKPKVDDLQKRMLAMAGQDVDAYLMQMEEVHRRTQAEKQAEFQNRMETMQPDGQPRRFGAMPPGPPPGLPPTFGPPGMMMRPSLPPPGVRLPPGPPPGRPPLRMPPGPPPGIPPARLGAMPAGARMPPMPRPLLGAGLRAPGPISTGVVSAGPQLIPKSESKPVPSSASPAPSSASVIESKPKIRNLLNDVTRFVPTKVKVHMKDGTGPADPSKRAKLEPKKDVFAKHSQPVQAPQANKDDAYALFMKEMEQMMK